MFLRCRIATRLVILILSFQWVATAYGQEPTTSVAQLRAQYESAIARGESPRQAASTVRDWILANELTRYSLEDLTWTAERLKPTSFDHRYVQVEVVWDGQLSVPADGRYELYALPVGTSIRTAFAQCKQSVSVWLDGEQVSGAGLEATKPMNLEAGRATPIRIKLTYERSGYLGTRGTPIQLSVVSRTAGASEASAVPVAWLSSSGKPGGLQGEYLIRRSGEPEETISRMDSRFDFTWATIEAIRGDFAEARNRVSRVIFDLLMKEQDGTSAVSAATLEAVSDLSAAQRTAVGFSMIDRGSVIAAIPATRIKRVSQVLRGNDLTLGRQIVLAWCASNPSIAPVLADKYRQANRDPYRAIADEMFLEDPEAKTLLETIAILDGKVNLPAAYILAYVMLRENQLPEWTRRLEEGLANEALDGDQRVNWLFARAHAQEIRGDESARHVPGRLDSPLAGRHWLAEARSIAASPETRRRATHEYVARLVSSRDVSVVLDYLADVSNEIGDTSEWEQSLSTIHSQREALAEAVRNEQQRAN